MGNDCSVTRPENTHRVLLVRPPQVVLDELAKLGVLLSPQYNRMLVSTRVEVKCWDGEAVHAEDWRELTGNIRLAIVFMSGPKSSRTPAAIQEDIRSGSPSSRSIGVLLPTDTATIWEGIVDEVVTLEVLDPRRETFRLMCIVAPHFIPSSLSRPLGSLLQDLMSNTCAASAVLLDGQSLVHLMSTDASAKSDSIDWDGALALRKSPLFRSHKVRYFHGVMGSCEIALLSVMPELYLLLRFEDAPHPGLGVLSKPSMVLVSNRIRVLLGA